MAGRDSLPPMRGFVDQYGLDFMPHTVSEDGSLWARFGVAGQPAWLFIDNKGEVETHLGPMDEASLTQKLEELIAT
jgi:hypothetical protein